MRDRDGASFQPSFSTSVISTPTPRSFPERLQHLRTTPGYNANQPAKVQVTSGDRGGMAALRGNTGSTGKGILIGVLSAFGSAGVAIIILALFFFFRYTQRGHIILDRIGRPGEYDDEQEFAREESEALEAMDELQQTEYFRAKGAFLREDSFVQMRDVNQALTFRWG